MGPGEPRMGGDGAMESGDKVTEMQQETKLEKDVRNQNAKVRLQERARKNQEEGAEEPAKRRNLAQIKDNKLAQFGQHRKEYVKDREQERKRKKHENTSDMQEAANRSQGFAMCEEM